MRAGRLIRGDERKLKQIATNLLSNPVKFTPAGGEIVIAVRIDERRLGARGARHRHRHRARACRARYRRGTTVRVTLPLARVVGLPQRCMAERGR